MNIAKNQQKKCRNYWNKMVIDIGFINKILAFWIPARRGLTPRKTSQHAVLAALYYAFLFVSDGVELWLRDILTLNSKVNGYGGAPTMGENQHIV